MIIAIICILTNLTGKCYELVFAYTALITIELPCFLYIYCAFDSVVCVCLLFFPLLDVCLCSFVFKTRLHNVHLNTHL